MINRSKCDTFPAPAAILKDASDGAENETKHRFKEDIARKMYSVVAYINKILVCLFVHLSLHLVFLFISLHSSYSISFKVVFLFVSSHSISFAKLNC